MKKIESLPGVKLDETLLALKLEAKFRGEDCYYLFNGKEIYSTDTLDEAYLRITGRTYDEHCVKMAAWRERRELEKQYFEKKIPELTEFFRSEARGIIAEKDLAHWDEIVPARLEDIYHGLELSSTLDIVKIMNQTDQPLESRISQAKSEFIRQGHSGMSAVLMYSMLTVFCPEGQALVTELQSPIPPEM